MNARPTTGGVKRSNTHTILIGALVVGFVFLVCVPALDRRPASPDEGLNVALALRDLSELPKWLIYTGDNEPLLHRALLGVHLRLAGSSLFAARYFSVAWAVLAAALIFHILRKLGASCLAAALATMWATSLPLVMWHATEAKTYALSLALTSLSWLLWMRLVARPNIAQSLLYVLVTAGLLHTHYYTALVPLSQWGWLLVDKRWRSDTKPIRRLALFALMQGGAALPVAAWVLASGYLLSSVSNTSIGFAPRTLAEFVLEVSHAPFAERLTRPAMAALGTALALGVLIAGGIKSTLDPAKHRLVAHGAHLALVLALSFSVQTFVPFFHPRFLVFALPHVAALAAGVVSQTSFGRWVGAALILVGTAANLAVAQVGQTTHNPAEADLRASLLEARPYIQFGDALVEGFIWSEGLLAAYAPELAGRLRPYYVQTLDPERVMDTALPIAQSHRRIWLQRYKLMPHSADDWLEQWLLTRTGVAVRFDHPAARVSLFVSPLVQSGAVVESPVEARASFGAFGEVFYRPMTITLSSPAVGEALGFVLRWVAPEAPAPHARVFVHLVSAEDQLVAQNDGDPINGLAPNFTWAPGAVIADPRAVLIQSPLAPGRYELRFGLYRVADGQRVHTASGDDFVRLGQVEVSNTNRGTTFER